jgi:hypothetical protein
MTLALILFGWWLSAFIPLFWLKWEGCEAFSLSGCATMACKFLPGDNGDYTPPSQRNCTLPR